MLRLIITQASEVARLKRMGIVERPQKTDWLADQHQRPFSQRDYGHTFKTIVRGSKKRT